MAKNPTARYATAAELAEALKAAASGQPLPAPPANIYEALTEDISGEELAEQRDAPQIPTPMAAPTPGIAPVPTVQGEPEVKQRKFPVAVVIGIGVLLCVALAVVAVIVGGRKLFGPNVAQANPQPTDVLALAEETGPEEQPEEPSEASVLVITATSEPGQPAPTNPPPSDTPESPDTPAPDPEEAIVDAIMFFDEEMRYLLGTNDTSRMDQAARGEALSDRYDAAATLRQAGINLGTDPCIWDYDHKGIDIEEIYFVNSGEAEVYAQINRSGKVFCGGVEQSQYAFRGPCTALYTVKLFGDQWFVTNYDADCVE